MLTYTGIEHPLEFPEIWETLTLMWRKCNENTIQLSILKPKLRYWIQILFSNLTHWDRDNMAAIIPDDIFKCIFLNETMWISTNISLKFVPKGPINNIPALGQIMAWRRPGDKPLSEPMMVILLTHICVTWPHWVKQCNPCERDASHQGYKNLELFLVCKSMIMSDDKKLHGKMWPVLTKKCNH